ncbi:MAG: glycosyltransferase family 4 protein [Nitrososphaeria archaeon]
MIRVLFVRAPPEKPRMGGPSNVTYYLSMHLPLKNVEISFLHRFWINSEAIKNLVSCLKNVIRKQFDIIHINNTVKINDLSVIELVKLAKISKTPVIVNVHGIISHILYRLYSGKQWSHKVLEEPLALSGIRFLCNEAVKVIVNSTYMMKAVEVYYKTDPQKIVVIPNGVDISEFRNAKPIKTLDGDPSVLYVGRLSWEKGVDVLLHAIKLTSNELPRIKLHIVGDGPLIGYLRQLVDKLDIRNNVKFWSYIKHRNVVNMYISADICVVPSLFESFGLTVLESMAAGKPLIASAVGGIVDIVRNGENGLLVRPNNPQALSKAILKISFDGNLRIKLIKNALNTALKYSWDKIAEKYVALYENLII